MPTAVQKILLFPGQGAHRDDELPALARHHPQVAQAFDEVDAVAARLGATPPGPQVLAGGVTLESLLADAPDVLQLAIFATSIGLFNVLRDSDEANAVLVGHSSGEIAALVAGGAFTVAEGAEIIVRRSALLERITRGSAGMVALGCDERRAWRLVDAVADPRMVVAVENGQAQTVVSGPHEALSALIAIAHPLRVPATLLPAAYPFHSPGLAPLVAEFAAAIAHLRPRPLTALVYSPILGRFHRQGDRLTDHLADSLVAPVRFGAALRELSEAGAQTFVDCSIAAPLARLTQRSLPDATAVAAVQAAAPQERPVARVHAPVAVPTPVPTPVSEVSVTPAAASGDTRDEVFAELAEIYAGALEYPVEVFTESVALEADLGIDSVKQTELLARAAERYGLPEPPADFRLGDYDTMGKLVDYLWAARGSAGALLEEAA
jgi:acyl transferase domain-containing protein/acyl carrier protein